jgi:hypothetical protein
MTFGGSIVNNKLSVSLAALLIGSSLGVASMALAQTPAVDTAASPTAFPDIPDNHWAYQAIQDLANKGLVKGYPDGKFLGNRELTRYEFASVIDRILQTLEDIKSAPAPAPAQPAVSDDDLNKIQVLVDTFQTQLNAQQDNIVKAQADVQALRKDVADTKVLVKKAQDTADNSYGAGPGRKFTISGYIQARYDDAQGGNSKLYPSGAPASNSPYNGNYAQGGTAQSLNIRRARIKVAGQPTTNTKYALQIDVSGVANPTIKTSNASTNTSDYGIISTSASAVAVKEADITYTPGNGSSTFPSVTAGQFKNIYGYSLPITMDVSLTPERPLGFNEGSNGLFNNEDYVRGAEISYGPGQIHFAAAVVSGNGYSSTNTSSAFEQIYRLNYLSKNNIFGVGVSYDQGPINTAYSGTALDSSVVYKLTQKQLVDYDAQITLPSGPFLIGEYESGPYQQVSYLPTSGATATTSAAPGNDIQAYYIQGGYTFHKSGNHPFSLVYSHDTLIRAEHGYLLSGVRYSLDDVNDGYGILYNLDKSTRLRFWYTAPESVAYLGSTPEKVGLFTTELQIRY